MDKKRLLVAGLLVCGMNGVGRGEEFMGNKTDSRTNQLPRYSCRKVAAGAIMIDGKLDDDAWQNATVMDRFLTCDKAEPAKYSTRAWAVYDEQYLYVAFEIHTPGIKATMTRHDDDLWKEDVVEVFLDPAAEGSDYFEIEVNALNTLYDARIEYAPGKLSPEYLTASKKLYDSKGIRTAVAVTPPSSPGGLTVWTVELAIPFDEMEGAPHRPPRPGDAWRWNLYRVDCGGEGKEELALAWSPTMSWTHKPGMFGWLEFK